MSTKTQDKPGVSRREATEDIQSILAAIPEKLTWILNSETGVLYSSVQLKDRSGWSKPSVLMLAIPPNKQEKTLEITDLSRRKDTTIWSFSPDNPLTKVFAHVVEEAYTRSIRTDPENVPAQVSAHCLDKVRGTRPRPQSMSELPAFCCERDR